MFALSLECPVNKMPFNYLVLGKILLQLLLFAIFFNYFGVVSWKRYQEQRVVLTSSDEAIDNLPAPAVTLCPADHEDRIGYIDALYSMFYIILDTRRCTELYSIIQNDSELAVA